MSENWTENYDIDREGNVIKLAQSISPYFGSKYPTVSMTFNGKQRVMQIHRLLAEKYIPNPDNKPFVNHKDGNKLNYSLDNLEWVTAQENTHHAFRTGLTKWKMGEPRPCVECGGSFRTKPSRSKTSRGKFCSKECYSLNQTVNPNMGSYRYRIPTAKLKKMEAEHGRI